MINHYTAAGSILRALGRFLGQATFLGQRSSRAPWGERPRDGRPPPDAALLGVVRVERLVGVALHEHLVADLEVAERLDVVLVEVGARDAARVPRLVVELNVRGRSQRAGLACDLARRRAQIGSVVDD